MQSPHLEELLDRLNNLIDRYLPDVDLVNVDKSLQDRLAGIRQKVYLAWGDVELNAIKIILENRIDNPQSLHDLRLLITGITNLQKEKKPVYVASSAPEAQAHRQVLTDYLASSNYWYDLSSDGTSKAGRKLPEQYRDALDAAELFLGFYGDSYGELIQVDGLQDNLSVTEFEWTYSANKLRRCICMLAQEGTPELQAIPPTKPPEFHLNRIAFNEYYARHYLPKADLALQIAYIKSGLKKLFSRDLIEERAKYSYKRTNQIVDKIETQYGERRRQEYIDACARYEQLKARQQAFRTSIKQHFHTYSFSSTSSLAEQLDKALEEFRTRRLVGISTKLLAGRWKHWTLRQRSEDIGPLAWGLGLQSAMESDPINIIQGFVNYKWHEEIRGKFENIERVVTDAGFFVSMHLDTNLPANVEPKIFDLEYGTIHATLVSWVESSKKDIGQAKKIHAETREKLSSSISKEIKRQINCWEDALKDLNAELERSRFGRCLLVTGRSGSGKTHLMYRALDLSADIYSLPLDLNLENSDFESQILNKARLVLAGEPDPADLSWRDLDELERYISGKTLDQFPSSKLMIVVEAFDSWPVEQKRQLLDFINKTSCHHSLYWIIVIPENAVPAVVDHKSFWTRYGYVPNGYRPIVPGWLSLDDINQAARIWTPIFNLEIGESEINKIEDILAPSAKKALCTPLIAWTVVKLKSKGALLNELLNLNYIEFVKYYWEVQLEEIAKSISSDDVETYQSYLVRAVRKIAREFLVTSNVSFDEVQLLDLLETDRDPNLIIRRNLAEKVILALSDKSLLLRNLDPSVVGRSGNHYTLAFQTFWHYWAGQVVVDLFEQHEFPMNLIEGFLRERILPYLDQSSFSSNELFEFCLLWIDKSITSTAPARRRDKTFQFLQHVVKLVFYGTEQLQPSLWQTLAKMSNETQQKLADWLIKSDTIPLADNQALFSFLYFLKNSPLSSETGVSPSTRLALLQPHFSSIGGNSLTDYFETLIDEITPEDLDRQEFIRVASNLFGAEVILNAVFYGEWAYRRIQASISATDDEKMDQLTGAMTALFQHSAKYYNSADRRDFRVERQRIWSFAMDCYLNDLVNHHGVKSIEYLKHHRWFNFDKNRLMWQIVEDLFTTTMGHWYRHNAGAYEQAAYEDTVSTMSMSSNSNEKIRAIYLIYHTVPNVKLDAALSPPLFAALERLWDDKDPAVRRTWSKTNLGEFYHLQKSEQ